MTIIEIKGGLGNQLFQYAFSRAIELENQIAVRYDFSYYVNTPKADTKRNNYIINLVREKKVKPVELFLFKVAIKVNKIIEMLHMNCFALPYGKIVEDDYCCNLPEINKNVLLKGYWQSEKYFMKYSDVIRDELDFSKLILSENEKRIKDMILQQESVSIHVRGGDYLNHLNYDRFGEVCNAEYYTNALSLIMNDNLREKSHFFFFVFTNDIAYSKNLLLPIFEQFDIKDYFFVSSQLTDSAEWVELYLMSLCNINVIANSSYSWWAAWLNEHSAVYCPTVWDKCGGMKNTICDRWIKV